MFVQQNGMAFNGCFKVDKIENQQILHSLFGFEANGELRGRGLNPKSSDKS
jgi:hypothetical protein